MFASARRSKPIGEGAHGLHQAWGAQVGDFAGRGLNGFIFVTPGRGNTMIKALARAFRWRDLLETGVFATVDEIAVAEKINASYVSRVLRLTLLAPDIVEAILSGRQPPELTLAALMRPFPVEWREQGLSLRG